MGPAKTETPVPIHTSVSIAQESIPANNVKNQDDLINASRVPKMHLNLHLQPQQTIIQKLSHQSMFHSFPNISMAINLTYNHF